MLHVADNRSLVSPEMTGPKHEHRSLLLVSTVFVCPICAVSNVVIPDQTELACKMIFSDPRHRTTRDAGAGRLFILVYIEATPSLTGDST